MDLFNEIKNDYYTLTRELINEIYNSSETINMKDFKDFYMKNSPEIRENSKDFFFEDVLKKERKIDNFSLFSEKDGKINLSAFNQRFLYKDMDEDSNKYDVNIPIPILFTDLEKRYLKFLLTDDLFRNMIGEDISKKLDDSLKSVPNSLDVKKHFIYKADMTEEKIDYNILETIIEAIKNNLPISYINNANNGKKYESKAIPYRILFSSKNKKWQIILIPIEEETRKAILVNIDRLEKVKLYKNASLEEIEETKKYRELIENKRSKNPLELEIKIKYTSIERSFALFSKYEKEAKFNEETQTYHLKIYYYDFDESVIIRDILSLGDAVKVTSPEKIRNKIIERISKIKC